MYLLDTNIIIELLLGRDRAKEIKSLFQQIHYINLFLTDFALHSVGVILERHKLHELIIKLAEDLRAVESPRLISLDIDDFNDIVDSAIKFKLDFDDAYQYVAATKYDLTIISFDKDFDRTDRGRKTPGELLRELGE